MEVLIPDLEHQFTTFKWTPASKKKTGARKKEGETPVYIVRFRVYTGCLSSRDIGVTPFNINEGVNKDRVARTC